MKYFIGLLSGTSMDGIDAVLVDFSESPGALLATHSQPIPTALKQQMMALTTTQKNEIDLMCQLDRTIAQEFSAAVETLLAQTNVSASEVIAIGSHGQTLRHQPNGNPAYTLQIGDPNTIAHLTGITTVADFRRRDIANGGQGAPLTPLFHAHCFQSKETNCVLNIGGFSNITVLPAQNSAESILGFDTGPGNILMDAWIYEHQQKNYDKNGAWAASGTVNSILLDNFLSDPFFAEPIPKSTGSDYFHLQWLHDHLSQLGDAIDAADVQATLLALTVESIAKGIEENIAEKTKVIVCGGGVHNNALFAGLEARLREYKMTTSDEMGVPADWVEAMAFAWFAQETMQKNKLDLTTITGAKKPAVLGGIYW